MLREADHVSRAGRVGLSEREWSLAQSFASCVTGTLLASPLGLPLPIDWALMFVFLILAAAAGRWTVWVCMACPADTVLAAFQGIRHWMMWLRERFKKPACYRFWVPGLDIGDGSRPDGIRVFTFSGRRSLVWDCTCVDTFAALHLNWSAMEAGIAANYAEELKLRKYAALAETHQFEPIAVGTMGVYMVSPLESSLGQ